MIAVGALSLAVALLASLYGRAALLGLCRLAGTGGGALPSQDLPPFPILALVGLAVLSAGAALVSLLGGLGGIALGTAVAGGVALAARSPRFLPGALREELAGLRAGGVLAGLVFAAGIGLGLVRSAVPTLSHDAGAYHAQAIRWLEEYGTVPGLGNLNARLALGSGWFVPSALFGLAFVGRPLHGLNGTLFLLLLVFGLAALGPWRAGGRRASLFLRAVLPVACFWLFGRWLSSPSPDVPTAALLWLVGVLFLEEIEDGLAGEPTLRSFTVVVLASYAVAIKLSAAPAGLLPLYLLGRHLAARRWRAAAAVAGAAAAVLLPFTLLTVVASGYLVFPLPGLDLFAFDWQIPPARAATVYNWVKAWARVPHRPGAEVLAMPFQQWLPLWWRHQPWGTQAVLALLPVLALARLAAAARSRMRGGRLPAGAAALHAAFLLGTAFWFAMAPDPRFGWGFLLFLLLLLAVPLLRPALARLSAPALAALLLAAVLWEAKQMADWEPGTFADAARHALLPAPYRVPETRTEDLGDFAVAVPVTNDQCWYVPLPCTPYPDPAIDLRGPTLAGGFRYRGGSPP